VVFFNVVVQTIDAFKAFTPAFIISGGTGGPIDATLFYTLYLYQEAFAYFRMGYASALALGAGGDHRGLHRVCLPVIALLGALRWLIAQHPIRFRTLAMDAAAR
jgi:hypothetical protein